MFYFKQLLIATSLSSLILYFTLDDLPLSPFIVSCVFFFFLSYWIYFSGLKVHFSSLFITFFPHYNSLKIFLIAILKNVSANIILFMGLFLLTNCIPSY